MPTAGAFRPFSMIEPATAVKRRTTHVLIAVGAAACVLGLLAPWLAPLLPSQIGWYASLASHWQLLYATVLTILVLAAVVMLRGAGMRWLWALPAVALPLLSASPRLAKTDQSPDVRIVAANLQKRTEALQRLRAWVNATQPDVIVLSEVTPSIADASRHWRDYPYRLEAPQHSAFGMLLLAKRPLLAPRIERDTQRITTLRATIAVDGETVELIGFHPMPPMTPRMETGLREELKRLTRGRSASRIIAGDFNATVWSPALRQLDATRWRRAMPLRPTWPAQWRGLFGIGIDQVIANTDWQVVQARVGPANGSDHLPVFVALRRTPVGAASQ